MPDLLLEFYSEEIPARLQKTGADALRLACERALKAQAVEARATKTYYAPQRVALWMQGLEQTQTAGKSVRGPRCDAPKAALDGFLRKHGAHEKQLVKEGGYYVLARRGGGANLEQLLVRALSSALADFVWPKSMRWGADELRWVRPLRNILCLLDDAVLPLALGALRANQTLRGHRFLAAQPIALQHARDYARLLKQRRVIADADERRRIIEQESARLLPRGQKLAAAPALLDELAGLVEYPCVLLGRLDKAFLKLPPPVLRSVMESQQKYLCAQDGRGRLAPHFLVVANHWGRDKGKRILAGHQQVLRARLQDAVFFWQQDKARGLAQMAPGLETLMFEARLGTMRARAQRLMRLSAWLAGRLAPALAQQEVRRAASLCKADLLSAMVQEHPALQGEMGAVYARLGGESLAVARAIREHYLPRHAADALPATRLGKMLALAERLDLLAGFWLLDSKPSASKDPYGLRRAALGLVRLAAEENALGDIGAAFAQALAGYRSLHPAATGSKARRLRADFLHFLRERLARHLRDRQGLRSDVFAALQYYEAQHKARHKARHEKRAGAGLDIARTQARALNLQAFLQTRAGADLFVAFHRAAGLLQKGVSPAARAFQRAGVAAKPSPMPAFPVGTPQAALRQALAALDARLALLSAAKQPYRKQLADLAKLRAPMDRLFADVLIEDKKPAVRAAHHALLLRAVLVIAAAAGDLGRIDQSAFGAPPK